MNTPLFQHTKQQEYCPVCDSPLQIKQGKKGLFLGCSAYPACDYLKPLSSQPETKVIKVLDQSCSECGQSLVLKQGHFGMFIACGDYPNCHFIVHNEPETQAQESLPCPECHQGKLVARRGRQGKIFYGCDCYPQCKFTLASQPHQVSCPECNYSLSTLKKTTETHRTYQCANKSCKHIFNLEIEA
ncbi:hypothetical protein GVX81_09990 [[Haemophilus] felis]|uniref:DNA topoisomerase type IA zn finger domain-containing protein n=1 Tax=[Haemophilus] felis TaxID=123822 RepID=A0A1T0AX33_9PAST|nr:hypothetical protein [[Haemophilus] felis]NBI40986.1 hypothetical protein [[Haemophilus] felis]OOS02455.1 hypothetical protein B0188_08810 [[Haemophilus] felis]